MKKYLILFLFLISAHIGFSQEKIEWLKFEEAVAANKSNPKMLLVDVYTDWCGWCKVMDKNTFTDPEVISYVNENFYAVKLNAEDTKRTFEFMGKTYSEAQMANMMRVNSYPNFVIIEPTLQNITQFPGYKPPQDFLKGINEVVEKAFKIKP